MHGPVVRGVSGPFALGFPGLDVLTEPESDSTAAEIDDRSGEVVVSAEVGGDGVVVAEAEDGGDLGSADEVLGIHLGRHEFRLHMLSPLGGNS